MSPEIRPPKTAAPITLLQNWNPSAQEVNCLTRSEHIDYQLRID
jgi:hypothetical protein